MHSNSRTIIQLRNVLRRIRPTVQIRVLYRTAITIQNFFRIKDLTPRNLLSNVVYQVTCKDCNAQYIGKTIRHIEVRLNEHKKSTGLQSQSKSHIAEHARLTGHCINYEDFKVLGQANSDKILLIKESLYISKLKPTLNNNLTSVPLNLFT